MRKKLLKSLVIAGVMMMFPMSAMAADGDVAIDATNFPDETFRTYISENFDGGDGVLSQEELDAVTEIDMYSIGAPTGATSLEGLEYFEKLESLQIWYLELDTLDLTSFQYLTSIGLMEDVTIESLYLPDFPANTTIKVSSWGNDCVETIYYYMSPSSGTCWAGIVDDMSWLSDNGYVWSDEWIAVYEDDELAYMWDGDIDTDIDNDTDANVEDEDYEEDSDSNEYTSDNAQALVDTSVDKENLVVETEDNAMTFAEGAIDIIADSIAETLSVTMGDVEFVLDSTAIKAIQEQIMMDVTLKAVYVETEELTDDVLAIVGDKPVYQFLIYDAEGNVVSDFDGGSITVTIPYTLGEDETADNLVIYYISDDEVLETIEIDSYDAENELLTFTVTHFSTYAVGYEEDVDDTTTGDTTTGDTTTGDTTTDDTTTDDTTTDDTTTDDTTTDDTTTDDTTTDDTTTDDDTDDTTTSPETGDTANIMLYVMLAVLACGGIVVATKRRIA